MLSWFSLISLAAGAAFINDAAERTAAPALACVSRLELVPKLTREANTVQVEGRKRVGVRASRLAANALAEPPLAAGPVDARLATRPKPRARAPVPQGRGVGQGVVLVVPVARPTDSGVVTLSLLPAAAPLAPREGRAAVGDPSPVPSRPSGPAERKATSRRRRYVTSAVAPPRPSRRIPARHEARTGLELGPITPGVLA